MSEEEIRARVVAAKNGITSDEFELETVMTGLDSWTAKFGKKLGFEFESFADDGATPRLKFQRGVHRYIAALRRHRVQEKLQDFVFGWTLDRPRKDRTDPEKFDGTTLMAKVSERHAFFSTFRAPRHRLTPLERQPTSPGSPRVQEDFMPSWACRKNTYWKAREWVRERNGRPSNLHIIGQPQAQRWAPGSTLTGSAAVSAASS